MKNYELMNIWRTRDCGKSIVHDFEASLPEYESEDMTDSESQLIGSPMEIVKYILKEDLKDYKLVKRQKRQKR